MAYKENKNPLTGMGNRHHTAAISSVMGLSKSRTIQIAAQEEAEQRAKKPGVTKGIKLNTANVNGVIFNLGDTVKTKFDMLAPPNYHAGSEGTIIEIWQETDSRGGAAKFEITIKFPSGKTFLFEPSELTVVVTPIKATPPKPKPVKTTPVTPPVAPVVSTTTGKIKQQMVVAAPGFDSYIYFPDQNFYERHKDSIKSYMKEQFDLRGWNFAIGEWYREGDTQRKVAVRRTGMPQNKKMTDGLIVRDDNNLSITEGLKGTLSRWGRLGSDFKVFSLDNSTDAQPQIEQIKRTN